MKSVMSNKTAMNDQVPPIARCQNANPPALSTVNRRLRHLARAEASDNLPTNRNCCVVHSMGVTVRHYRAGARFGNADMTVSCK